MGIFQLCHNFLVWLATPTKAVYPPRQNDMSIFVKPIHLINPRGDELTLGFGGDAFEDVKDIYHGGLFVSYNHLFKSVLCHHTPLTMRGAVAKLKRGCKQLCLTTIKELANDPSSFDWMYEVSKQSCNVMQWLNVSMHSVLTLEHHVPCMHVGVGHDQAAAQGCHPHVQL